MKKISSIAKAALYEQGYNPQIEKQMYDYGYDPYQQAVLEQAAKSPVITPEMFQQAFSQRRNPEEDADELAVGTMGAGGLGAMGGAGLGALASKLSPAIGRFKGPALAAGAGLGALAGGLLGHRAIKKEQEQEKELDKEQLNEIYNALSGQ